MNQTTTVSRTPFAVYTDFIRVVEREVALS
jgi:hypothetical protein